MSAFDPKRTWAAVAPCPVRRGLPNLHGGFILALHHRGDTMKALLVALLSFALSIPALAGKIKVDNKSIDASVAEAHEKAQLAHDQAIKLKAEDNKHKPAGRKK